MSKKKKILLASVIGLGALALIIVPTATVLALNSNSKTNTKENIQNGVISLIGTSNNNTNDYSTTLFQTTNQTSSTSIPLSVQASYYGNDKASLSYQWYSGIVGDASAVAINGATSANYTASINTNTLGNYYYFVKVSSNGITATSKQFEVSIIQNPTNVLFASNIGASNSVTFNSNGTSYLSITGVTFNIGNTSYSNANYGLTYQWYGESESTITATSDSKTSSSSGSASSTTTWTAIADANSMALPLSSTTNNYLAYKLVATGIYKGATFNLTSPTYKVTFAQTNGSVYITSGDVINNLTVPSNEGSYQTLSVNASNIDLSNYEDVSYQWLVNGVAISNATSSTYTLTSNDVSKTGSYVYTCTITATTGKNKVTFSSSDFTLNVVSATITSKLSNSTTNALFVINGSWAYNYLVLPNSTNLPTIYFDDTIPSSLTDLNANIGINYTFYFVNTASPSLSLAYTSTSPFLAFGNNWMTTLGLTAGVTYRIIGTYTVTLNGVALTNTASSITVNGTTLTFPTNSFLAKTSYLISIATASTPTVSINNSTTSSTTVALNSTGSATTNIQTSIVFNGLLGLKGSASGLTSSLNSGNATFNNILTKQVLNTNDTINSEYANVVINDGVMNYNTNTANGLTSLTVYSTNSDTLNTNSLPSTVYASTVITNNTYAYSASSTAKIQYANKTQATANLTHLYTNSEFAWNAFTTYFSNQANNNNIALNQWMYNVLNNVAFGNNLVQTAKSSSWVQISSIQQKVNGTLPNTGWGVSITNNQASYLIGTYLSTIASGTTLPFSSSPTNYQTLLLTSYLNFNTFSIGNNGSNVSESKYLSYTGNTLKGVLSFYVPFDYFTPSNISYDAVTWNAMSTNTNFGFTITDTTHPWTMLDVHTEIVKDYLQGFYFEYNSNMNTNIASNPLILTSTNDSAIPSYDIANS